MSRIKMVKNEFKVKFNRYCTQKSKFIRNNLIKPNLGIISGIPELTSSDPGLEKVVYWNP